MKFHHSLLPQYKTKPDESKTFAIIESKFLQISLIILNFVFVKAYNFYMLCCENLIFLFLILLKLYACGYMIKTKKNRKGPCPWKCPSSVWLISYEKCVGKIWDAFLYGAFC